MLKAIMRESSYVLPLVRNENRIHVLLGRERRSGKWCGFGGGLEGKETHQEAASREAWEESLGLLGHPKTIHRHLKYIGIVPQTNHSYYIYHMNKYDENLPEYYARFYDFLVKCPKLVDSKHCTEKTEISWCEWSYFKDSILRMHPKFREDDDLLLDEVFLTDLNYLFEKSQD